MVRSHSSARSLICSCVLQEKVTHKYFGTFWTTETLFLFFFPTCKHKHIGTVCLWDVNRTSDESFNRPRRIFRAGNMCPGKTPSASMSALRRSVCTRRDERTNSVCVYSAVSDRMATIRVGGRDGEKAWRFRLQQGDVQSMALMPDCDTIAFGTHSGAIRLWY